jgi:hypothetical protein
MACTYCTSSFLSTMRDYASMQRSPLLGNGGFGRMRGLRPLSERRSTSALVVGGFDHRRKGRVVGGAVSDDFVQKARRPCHRWRLYRE